ncbi:MAG: hypothetical protein M3144_09830 [Actinomycetota bacterium]|nr:hypothetical protein [Actinomycetota bacterium]
MSADLPAVFSALERNGRFHRDTALGRFFHPGTRSFREITASDSLHIAVAEDNRVSVHVDRVSPLAIRDGRPCRYSVLRTIAHNVTVVADALVRFMRGKRGAHACHLECTVVWVPDDEPCEGEAA